MQNWPMFTIISQFDSGERSGSCARRGSFAWPTLNGVVLEKRINLSIRAGGLFSPKSRCLVWQMGSLGTPAHNLVWAGWERWRKNWAKLGSLNPIDNGTDASLRGASSSQMCPHKTHTRWLLDTIGVTLGASRR